MTRWTIVKTTEDASALLRGYQGFHDSCLTGLSWRSGMFVDGQDAMHFGGPEDRVLSMTFQSQWEKRPLELCFTGVRCFHLAGDQEMYTGDIFECLHQVRTDLRPGRDEPLIVWSDDPYFSPRDIPARPPLAEPMDSYVVASGLRWRFWG